MKGVPARQRALAAYHDMAATYDRQKQRAEALLRRIGQARGPTWPCQLRPPRPSVRLARPPTLRYSKSTGATAPSPLP